MGDCLKAGRDGWMDSCGILDEFLRNGCLRWMNSLGIRMNRMNPFGIWMDSFGIWMIAFDKDEFLRNRMVG